MEQNAIINKGDIFSPDVDDETGNKKHEHYIVYLQPSPDKEGFYIGALLTHSLINANIPLHKAHFVETDENGNLYKIKFDKSLVANHPVYKKNDLNVLNIVGRLSKEGIAFIEKNIAAYEIQFIDRDIK